MPGFLYYFPSKLSSAGAAEVRAAGLGYVFDGDGDIVPRGVYGGPDGANGLIVARSEAQLAYKPAEQTWRKIPGSDAWVGYYTASPPGPEDLARVQQLPGHLVELCDGRKWLCPKARGVADVEGTIIPFTAIPQVLEFDEHGKWVPAALEARYARLWEISELFWQQWTKAAENLAATRRARAEFYLADAPSMAVEVLAVNYRLGPCEVSALKLFNSHLQDGAASRVLQALVDWPSWDDLLKKKLADPDTSSSGDGPAEEPPGTAPPSPT